LKEGVINDYNFAFYWSLDEAGIHSGLVLIKMLMERFHASIQSCVLSEADLRSNEDFARQGVYLDALKSRQNTVLKVLKVVWDAKVTTPSLIAQMREVGSFVPFAIYHGDILWRCVPQALPRRAEPAAARLCVLAVDGAAGLGRPARVAV
jgi:hypothetical protein